MNVSSCFEKASENVISFERGVLMNINQSFGQFFGDIATVVKQAANSSINIAVIVTNDNDEIKQWIGTGMNPFYIESSEGFDSGIGEADAKAALHMAIERHLADMQLVNEGVFEAHDVGYNAIDAEKGLTATYYDICERLDGGLIPGSLGKALARIGIVMSCPSGGYRDTFAAQDAVCRFIRGFLSKNNLGTATDVSGWGEYLED